MVADYLITDLKEKKILCQTENERNNSEIHVRSHRQKTKIKNIFFIKLWQTNDAPGNSLCSSILNHFPHSARICNQVSSRSYQFFWSEKVFVGLIFYLNTYLHTIIFYQLK